MRGENAAVLNDVLSLPAQQGDCLTKMLLSKLRPQKTKKRKHPNAPAKFFLKNKTTVHVNNYEL